MVKRKVESDEDEDWGPAVKSTSRTSQQKHVSRAPRVATTRVKNEHVEYGLEDLPVLAAAGPSNSHSQASTSASPVKLEDAAPVPSVPHRKAKRVKKETAEQPEEKRLAGIRKSCPKVSYMRRIA